MTTLEDLDNKLQKCFNLKKEYDVIKERAEGVYNDLKRTQLEIASLLEELGTNKFASKYGNFSFRYSSSFKVPKSPENKKKFFEYLKSRELFDEMVTVNSRTLNSWAREEEIYQTEVLKSLNFEIPGIEKGNPDIVISMTNLK